MIKEDAQHKHRPAPVPPIERATVRPDAETAALNGPGDSLAEAIIEAELSFALARARLQAVKERLRTKGEAITSIGGGYFLRPTPQTTRIHQIHARPESARGVLK
jgi:hypothetical protein